MKIAVASQNRREVTGHTGRCRRFWLYDVVDDEVAGKSLLELAMAQSFHDSSPHEPHPLDAVDVLISGGMGQGLTRRLGRMGIAGIVTTETDPDRAVARYLDGSLPVEAPGAGGRHRQLRGERERSTGDGP